MTPPTYNSGEWGWPKWSGQIWKIFIILCFSCVIETLIWFAHQIIFYSLKKDKLLVWLLHYDIQKLNECIEVLNCHVSFFGYLGQTQGLAGSSKLNVRFCDYINKIYICKHGMYVSKQNKHNHVFQKTVTILLSSMCINKVEGGQN